MRQQQQKQEQQLSMGIRVSFAYNHTIKIIIHRREWMNHHSFLVVSLVFIWCYNRRCNACFGKNDNGNCERTAATTAATTTTIIIITASGGRDGNISDYDLGCDSNGNEDCNRETIYDDNVYHIINLPSLKLKFEKKIL